jgi:mannose-6-phosphate isomerase class I
MMLRGEQRRTQVTGESFLSLTVTEGTADIVGEIAKRGDSFFCPAGAGEITLSGEATVIAVSVPKS